MSSHHIAARLHINPRAEVNLIDSEDGEHILTLTEKVLLAHLQDPLAPLPTDHVVYKSFYPIDRPVGRLAIAPHLHRAAQEDVAFGAELNCRCAEIGLTLGPEYRGQGYGREVLALLLDFGFTHRNLHRVWLECTATNLLHDPDVALQHLHHERPRPLILAVHEARRAEGHEVVVPAALLERGDDLVAVLGFAVALLQLEPKLLPNFYANASDAISSLSTAENVSRAPQPSSAAQITAGST